MEYSIESAERLRRTHDERMLSWNRDRRYSGCTAFVVPLQPADIRKLDDPTQVGRLNGSMLRCIHLQ
jgi:hypothetical protein